MVLPRWAENSRRDLEDVDLAETVLSLPTGAVEQHAPHLPASTDVFIAERADDVLALPELSYGYSPTQRRSGDGHALL